MLPQVVTECINLAEKPPQETLQICAFWAIGVQMWKCDEVGMKPSLSVGGLISMHTGYPSDFCWP